MTISIREPLTVLFDGECNLCNGLVQFLVRHDKDGTRFRFAAQQSDAGQSLLRQAGLPETGSVTDTILVYTGARVLTHSDAALEIARYLPAPFSLLYAARIIPRGLRDAVYRFIARNRYRWFGKRDQCMIPTPELKARFLT